MGIGQYKRARYTRCFFIKNLFFFIVLLHNNFFFIEEIMSYDTNNDFNVFTELILSQENDKLVNYLSSSFDNVFTSIEYDCVSSNTHVIIDGDLVFRKVIDNEYSQDKKKKYRIDAGIIVNNVFNDFFVVVFFNKDNFMNVENLSDFIEGSYNEGVYGKSYSIMRFYDPNIVKKAVNSVKGLIKNPYCKVHEDFYVRKNNFYKPDYIDICKMNNDDFIISLFESTSCDGNNISSENYLYVIKKLKLIDHIFYNRHILKLLGDNIDIKSKGIEYRMAIYNNESEVEDININFDYNRLSYIYNNL